MLNSQILFWYFGDFANKNQNKIGFILDDKSNRTYFSDFFSKNYFPKDLSLTTAA